MRYLFLLALLLSELVFGQSGNFPALVGQRGTTLPTNCSVGQLFFKNNATAGANVYGCTAANTWTIQGSGAAESACTSSITSSSTTAAINTALAAGGVVCAGPGSYTLTGTGLSMPVPVTLRGAGIGVTTFLAPISTTANAIEVSGADVTLRQLTIDGQYALQTYVGGTTQTGVNLAATAHRFKALGIEVKNTAGMGVQSRLGATDTEVADSVLTNGALAASTVQASPAPSTTVFYVAPGTGQYFSTGMSLRIGAQTGIVASVDARTSYVATVTSTSVFTVEVGKGALFANGDVLRIGPLTGTVQSIASDTITLTGALATAPSVGQIVSVDKITLSPAITLPVAGNVVATTGGYLKAIYIQAGLRPVIRHNYFSGWSQAVGLWYGAKDGLVESNRFVANWGYEDVAHTVFRSVVEVYPADQNGGEHRVVNNYMEGTTSQCLEIAQGEVRSIFANNTCRMWSAEAGLLPGTAGSGIAVGGQNTMPGINSDISILGNTVISTGAFASAGVGVQDYVTTLKINNNTFYGFTGDTTGNAPAIGISNASSAGFVSPVIVGNTFNLCAKGVSVDSVLARGGVISSNFFYNQPTTIASHQILLNQSGDGWTIANNVIDTQGGIVGISTTRGIFISSGNGHRVVNNRIAVARAMNITMNDGLIMGNTITTNVQSIVIPGGVRNQIRFNTVFGSPAFAIQLQGAADNNVITDNQVTFATSPIQYTTTGVNNVMSRNGGNLPSEFTTTTLSAAPQTYTPDPSVAEVQEIIMVAGAGTITVAAPSKSWKGARLTLKFVNPGATVPTISLDATYKVSWTPSATASKINTLTVDYDGTSWIQVGGVVGI